MSDKTPGTIPHSIFETLILQAWDESGRSSDTVTWRFRLRDVRTGEHQTFASLDALLRYLDTQFGAGSSDEVIK